jgi:hypothetical protein
MKSGQFMLIRILLLTCLAFLLYKPVCAQTPVITEVTDRSGNNIISAAPGKVLLIHGDNFGSGLGGIQGWNYVCFCTTDNNGFINDYPLSNSKTRGGGFTSQNNKFRINSCKYSANHFIDKAVQI